MVLRFFLKGLSYIYLGLANFKNFFYDRGILDGLRLSSRVISVGNLTMGGTGKTPIVDLVINYFKAHQISVALVARNYKAQIRHTAQVDLKRPDGAQYYGDEAWMLAQKHPSVPVFVGPQKWFTSWMASKMTKAQILIVDDGFQHRALHRDLDIVLLDGTAKASEYEVLPLGRGRESWTGLRRAKMVVITKTNLPGSSPAQLDQLKSELKWSLSDQTPVIEAASEIDLSDYVGQKAIAFAGIAMPETFRMMIEQTGQVDLLKFLSFSDHQKYTGTEVDQILAASQGADVIFTTEKDAVKLNPTDFLVPLKVLPLATRLTQGASEFYASLDSVLR